MLMIDIQTGYFKARIAAETVRTTGEVCVVMRIIDTMLHNKHIGGPGPCAGYCR